MKSTKKSEKPPRLETLLKAGFLLLLFVITLTLLPREHFKNIKNLKEGEISPIEVISPIDYPIYKTSVELQKEREAALKSVPAFYEFDTTYVDSVREWIDRIKRTGLFKDGVPQSRWEWIVELSADYSLDYLKRGVIEDKHLLKSLGVDSVAIVKGNIIKVYPVESIKDQNDVYEELKRVAIQTFENRNERDVFLKIVKRLIFPNLRYREDLTNKARNAALARISPIKEIVHKGEKIVGKHERITEESREKLRILQEKIQSTGYHSYRWFAYLFILLSIYVLGTIYFLERIERRPGWRELIVIGFAGIIVLLSAYLVRNIHVSQYITLVPFFAILINVALGFEPALFYTLLLSIILGLYFPSSVFGTFIYNLILGWTAIFITKSFRSRFQIYYVILTLMIVGFVTSIFTDLLVFNRVTDVKILAQASLFSAFLSGVFVVGILPLYERVFRVATDFFLLELSNLNNPLLRELSEKASGTFNHSINVGNLCDAAARAIGANSLLARVGAYYHDIGKIKKPQYFIENQMGKENPHDRLSPRMSALIIISHVKDGVELGEKYGLPGEIIRIIQTHHGTSLLVPFYVKAKQLEGENVKEDDFRYPGPRPSTREEAICMIADSVEAAVRSLKNPTAKTLKETIYEIIRLKLEDGQLDEADITRKDLDKIAEAIYPILLSQFHPRIEYPREKK